MTLQEALEKVKGTLSQQETYWHAVSLINFDRETICPKDAMERQGETAAFLSNQAFRLEKDPEYIAAAELLYEKREELPEFDRVLAESIHRDRRKTKNISPELDHEFSLVYQKSYMDWLNAKQAADFSLFAPSLAAVRKVQERQVALRENPLPDAYNELLGDYEAGMTRETLDVVFDRCKERLIPLLKKIQASPKKIRRDFLSREVTDDAQRKLAEKLLTVMGYNFDRGLLATTEHPFTDGLAQNDVRVTTHFYPTQFISSMYSVIHEGGHALFEQLQPAENFEHHIQYNKTSGMHESVSRFYENVLGRSEAFIHLVYPLVCECFPELMADVSERELYEGVNLVEPSLVRTEADEFTYTLHIIIRYEIEKMIMDGAVKTEDLPRIWNEKYQEYLGVTPADDREGILQDVHWSSGFGYFPTYALGNMYNAMYYNRMKQELPVEELVKEGRFDAINAWMTEHVFCTADRREPLVWIKEITWRTFTPDDFLDYLEEKYSKLYEL